jgi:outer membrane protein OmpA-like peptidoglycan-associated protein
LNRIVIWGVGAIALALVAASCIRKQVNEQSLKSAPVAATAEPKIQAPSVVAPVAKIETPTVVPPTAVTSNPTASATTPSLALPDVKPTPDIKAPAIRQEKPAITKPLAQRKQIGSLKSKRPVAYAKKKRAVTQRKTVRRTVAIARSCVAKPGQQIVQSVCFATNSATLSNASKRKLAIAAAQLKSKANQKLEIAGFTDGSGNSKANLQLSERRSQAVVNYLVAQGVDRALLTNKGYGEESAKRAQQHRRVDLKVLQP